MRKDCSSRRSGIPTPVLYLEPQRLYRSIRGLVPIGDYTVPLGSSRMVREGKDVVLIAWSAAVHLCLAAADQLALERVPLVMLLINKRLLPDSSAWSHSSPTRSTCSRLPTRCAPGAGTSPAGIWIPASQPAPHGHRREPGAGRTSPRRPGGRRRGKWRANVIQACATADWRRHDERRHYELGASASSIASAPSSVAKRISRIRPPVHPPASARALIARRRKARMI